MTNRTLTLRNAALTIGIGAALIGAFSMPSPATDPAQRPDSTPDWTYAPCEVFADGGEVTLPAYTDTEKCQGIAGLEDIPTSVSIVEDFGEGDFTNADLTNGSDLD